LSISSYLRLVQPINESVLELLGLYLAPIDAPNVVINAGR